MSTHYQPHSLPGDWLEGLVKCMGRKKLAFIRLKDWEEERITRYTKILALLDPVNRELHSTVSQAYSATMQTSRFLKDVGKVYMETSRSLKSCNSTRMTRWMKYSHPTVLQTNQVPCISCEPEAQPTTTSLVTSHDSPASATSPSPVASSFRSSAASSPASSLVSHSTCAAAPFVVAAPSVVVHNDERKPMADAGHPAAVTNILSLSSQAFYQPSSSFTISTSPSLSSVTASSDLSIFSSSFSPPTTSAVSGGIPLRSILFASAQSEPWLLRVMELNQQAALQSEALGAFMEQDLVQGHLLKVVEEYDKSVARHFDVVKRAQLTLAKAHEQCLLSWQMYENVFRDVEKSDNEDAGKSSRRHQCCWTAERRYMFAAQRVQSVQRQYLQTTVESILALQPLERWRSETLRRLLQSYALKHRACLNAIGLTLQSVDRILDPNPYKKGRQQPKLKPRLSNTYLGSGNYYYRKVLREQLMYLENPDLYPVPGNSDAGAEKAEGAEKEPEEPSSNRNMAFLRAEPFLSVVGQCHCPPMPETNLVIKKGIVKRTSGGSSLGMGFNLSQKWNDGMLVLTWDRFLLMFKNPDDLSPTWSTCIAHMEARRAADKGKDLSTTDVIELRDKKKSFIGTGRSFQFRPLTATDCEEWLSCLQVVTSSESFYRAVAKDGLDRYYPPSPVFRSTTVGRNPYDFLTHPRTCSEAEWRGLMRELDGRVGMTLAQERPQHQDDQEKHAGEEGDGEVERDIVDTTEKQRTAACGTGVDIFRRSLSFDECLPLSTNATHSANTRNDMFFATKTEFTREDDLTFSASYNTVFGS